MTKDTWILSVLLIAAVAVLIRQRLAFPDDRTTAFVMLAVVILLAIAAGRSTSRTVELLGTVRQPPTRVSDPAQQGDMQPSTFVMAESIYWAALDKSKNEYRVYRYERAPYVPAGKPSSERVGDMTCSAPITALLVRKSVSPRMFLGCSNGNVLSYADPAAATSTPYGSVIPVTKADALDTVTSIAEDLDSVYLLGTTAGKAKVCRVSDDGKSYSALTDIDLGNSSVALFVVDKTSKTIATTYTYGDTKGIVAWRNKSGTWTKCLTKEEKGASIPEVKICRGRVLFLFAPAAKTPRLWSSDADTGVEISIDEPSLLVADEDHAYVAGISKSMLTVFQIAAVGDPVAMSFGAAGAPSQVHALVPNASGLKALTQHSTTHFWTLTGHTFGHDDDVVGPKKPRSLSPDGAAFFEGAQTLYVRTTAIDLASVIDASYSINLLVNISSDYLFVAKDKASGNLTVFSSYMGQLPSE